MSWRMDLTRPLKPVGHPPLRSLADARAYIRRLPEGMALQDAWLHAAELLFTAADFNNAAAIRAATDHVENALFFAARLDA